MPHKTAQLVIQAHPVLVLSNVWLEELFCPQCGWSHWRQITRIDRVMHQLRWAPRELKQQVAHIDPTSPKPNVSEYTRRNAGPTSKTTVLGSRLSSAQPERFLQSQLING